jgi:transcriptional regulator with XRE-family HTH domain
MTLPHGQYSLINCRYLKPVRLIRNLTQKELAELMEIDPPALSRLEREEIAFSPIYRERFISACNYLRISSRELSSIKQLLESQNL